MNIGLDHPTWSHPLDAARSVDHIHCYGLLSLELVEVVELVEDVSDEEDVSDDE
jgi:hypothetical protein